MRKIFFIIFIALFTNTAQSQNDSIKMYTFINYEQNIIHLPNNNANFNSLFNKMYNLETKNEGSVTIAHIGDSHIQADFLSGTIRKKLQEHFKSTHNDRGCIFPYKTAYTNNPTNYTVSTKGKWLSCRNVESNLKCTLGVAGIAVFTSDTSASISIKLNDTTMTYMSDKIMIFHEVGKDYFTPEIIYPQVIQKETNEELGYTIFSLDTATDSITLSVKQENPEQTKFVLQGVNFTSDKNNLKYHTFGVNGATFRTFLRCELLTKNLSALSPDLVIISLGTNDTYVNRLNTDKLSSYIDKTIKQIKQTLPNSAILLTTPGDHLMHQHKQNPNIIKCVDIIKEKAKQYNCAYWDYYHIMGGNGSIKAWRETEMAHTDFIHYTKKGYEYKGELFFNALLKSYNNFKKKY